MMEVGFMFWGWGWGKNTLLASSRFDEKRYHPVIILFFSFVGFFLFGRLSLQGLTLLNLSQLGLSLCPQLDGPLHLMPEERKDISSFQAQTLYELKDLSLSLSIKLPVHGSETGLKP
jgi:hypothetical protein